LGLETLETGPEARRTPPDHSRNNGRARSRAKLPAYDCLGNRILTFVHSNGIHGLGVRFCQCPEINSDDRHLHLLNAGFYPATQTNPSTVFTLSGLDYALIDNLECKTVPHAYSKKLRRLSDENDPGTVPNRYVELLRTIRQYRHLKTLITFGFGHQRPGDWQQPGVADLAWRCVACPSVANLPPNWQQSEDSWKYYRAIAMDGNFSAQHLASRVPENNINFTDGLGYFAKSDDYANYLKRSKDDLKNWKTPECHSHRAASNSGKSRDPKYDIKGIASCACARHGLFSPGGTANIQKGERQVNMDYALSQTMTIGGTEQIPRLLLLYDIMCQWGIHAKQRFALNGLSMPKVNEILRGVGIWHHIGLVDGEILETLWSLLNQVSESCQTMSLASREETINFHMNDINRKKNMEMKTLIRKWLKAQKLVRQRGRILEGLNESCTHDDRKQWQTEMDEILEKRITDPGIMDDFLSSVETEPQRADIELMMQKEEAACNEVPGRTKWVIEGIKLQEEQLRLQAHLVHSSSTQAEQRVTLNWQNQLGTKIVKHNDQGTQWLKEDAGDITSIRLHRLLDEDEWSGDSLVISGNTSQTCAVTSPEQRPIDLPSSRGLEFCRNNQEVATIEGDLRIAQADEHLHLIRQNLIHRANLYRTTIRHTSSNKRLGASDGTRSHILAAKLGRTVRLHAQHPESYRQKLPWFWLIKVKTRVDDDEYIASWSKFQFFSFRLGGFMPHFLSLAQRRRLQLLRQKWRWFTPLITAMRRSGQIVP
ncbi:hypothetical protein BC826DRAFT_976643, partial [Russula brevipes]